MACGLFLRSLQGHWGARSAPPLRGASVPTHGARSKQGEGTNRKNRFKRSEALTYGLAYAIRGCPGDGARGGHGAPLGGAPPRLAPPPGGLAIRPVPPGSGVAIIDIVNHPPSPELRAAVMRRAD